MNVKSLIVLFAFAGFAASCSNSDFDDPGTHPTDGRAEIQIALAEPERARNIPVPSPPRVRTR